VHDAGDLGPVQRAARVEAHEDGCRGFLLLAEEPVLLGQRQVHARALHRGQRLDGARELAFKPTLEVQALLELRHPEAAGLHHLEAGHRAFGQALRGQAQAHIVHPVRRHHDGAATFGVAVGDVHLRELRDDSAAILVRQVGKQDAVVLLAPEQDRGHGRGHEQNHADPQAQALGTVQGGEPLHPRRSGSGNSRGGHLSGGGHLAWQYDRSSEAGFGAVHYSAAPCSPAAR